MSRFRQKLNPEFAQAHGLAASQEDDVIVKAPAPRGGWGDGAAAGRAAFGKKKLELILKAARSTGKLNAVNIGLSSPLPDQLFDLRSGIQVDMSLETTREAQFGKYAEENLTLVDISDNTIEGNLDDERFSKFEKVQILRFRRCGYETVGLSFAPFDVLAVLDLSGNELKEFSLNLVPRKIQELNLAHNKLVSVTTDEPVAFPMLTSLDISENCLTALDHLKVTCDNLKAFRCDHNKIKVFDVPFLQSTKSSLQTLEASHNQIVSGADDKRIDLSAYTRLQSITFAFNKLVHIPCIGTAVTRLELHSNKLESIEGLYPANSTDTYELVDLLLHDNYIVSLDVDVIEKGNKLQRLDLSENRIKTLPYQLGFLPHLKSLRLGANPLMTFKRSDIEKTSAIMQVLRNRAPKKDSESDEAASAARAAASLVTNKSIILTKRPGLNLDQIVHDLKASPKTAFEVTGQLLIDDNKLSDTPADLFALLPNVYEISLSDNALTSIPATLGSSSSRLSKLHLARNRLASSSLDILKTSPVSWSNSLTRLDLSSNRLTSFPIEILSQLKNLDTLNLSMNRIQSVEEWTTLPLTLSNLNLSDNSLTDIESLVIRLGGFCSQLHVLSLANNNLRKIPYTMGILGDGITALQYLDLRGNPQHGIRYDVLQRDCKEQLQYIRNRLTSEGAKAALKEMLSIRRQSTSGETTASPATATVAVETAKENKTLSQANQGANPSNSENAEAKRVALPSSKTEEEDTPVIESVASNVTETSEATAKNGNGNNNQSVVVMEEVQVDETEKSQQIITELHKKIAEYERQLENPSITSAKRYAVKKSLAMERSKLIREERKLGLRK